MAGLFVCHSFEKIMVATGTYEIKLPVFEGPFDLLLFFIERDELDIYDIPIYTITQEFLNYMHQMEQMNIELASEFIVVAATLMRVKAKMLIPRKELDETGKEIDPRKELIDRLLEYKAFKEASLQMQQQEEDRMHRYKRGNIPAEWRIIGEAFSREAELHTLTLFKLLKAYERTLSRLDTTQARFQHTVVRYPHTIEDEKMRITTLVVTVPNASFEKIFEVCTTRIHAMFTFLSILELVQMQQLSITIGSHANEFWLNAAA